MSKVRLLSAAVVLLLATNFVALFLLVSRSGPHPNRKFGASDEPKMIIIEKLHFDEAQIRQYEKLIDQHRSEVRVIESKIRDAKTSLYQTLLEQDPSKKDGLENSLAHLQMQMEAVHYDHFLAIKKLCKPAQLIYFEALTKELANFFKMGKKMPPPAKD